MVANRAVISPSTVSNRGFHSLLTLANFLRGTPAPFLQAYFAHRDLAFPPDMTGEKRVRAWLGALLDAVDALSEEAHSRVVDDAQRIGAMADGPGQAALYAAFRDGEQDALDGLENGHARAVWTFLNAPAVFETAEQVRYADTCRYGRCWSGYVAQPGCAVDRTDSGIEGFKAALRESLRSRHVEIDICDRTRATLDEPVPLVQATIYREGRPESRKAFVAGQLDRIPDHPVIEAAITYAPRQGEVEAVAPDRGTRELLVRLFAEHLLAAPISGNVRLRQFSLAGLHDPFEFPTDPEDNIEAVRVQTLRLMPLDAGGERIILECGRDARRSVWAMAADRFGEHDPLAAGYVITQARFSVIFRPVPGQRGGRTVPVTITMPQGCDLKDRTARDRLIGEKYLARWGFVRSL
jgi:hypothetical protein